MREFESQRRAAAPKRRKQRRRKNAIYATVTVFAFIAALVFDIWFLFVGGIEQIVAAFSTSPLNGTDLAWGIVRVFGSGFVTVSVILFGIILLAVES